VLAPWLPKERTSDTRSFSAITERSKKAIEISSAQPKFVSCETNLCFCEAGLRGKILEGFAPPDRHRINGRKLRFHQFLLAQADLAKAMEFVDG